MARTEQQIYKTIADIVNNYAPAGWQKVFVKASIADDNGEALYDYIDESGKKKWFAPEAREQYVVFKAFQELRSLMRSSGNLWHIAYFTLEPSGAFSIEFDYEK